MEIYNNQSETHFLFRKGSDWFYGGRSHIMFVCKKQTCQEMV